MKTLKIGRPSRNNEKLLRQMENDTEVKSLIIHTDKKFHKEVKHFALENDITIAELIQKALKKYMEK